ncbi:hypothetical protein [Streptomyces sp. S465]|uniref:hypothetical protein n=1 Tax=Streptomyces sp. S465 TaxID=2979468 RepID=UPI0022A8CA87|nr:hypothetical protein [Streptomyces sp. S465]WAP55745.1 hypothetical protein N6H00_12555 [Streptomyces sp. S465]
MSTGAISIVVVVAVVLAAALVIRVVRAGASRKERALRRRFGPEYELTVAQHAGDAKAAQRELDERLRMYGDVKTQPLSGELRERYVAEWAGAQEMFIESPERAVAGADQLLARLARDRGYPSDGYEEQVAALSVHHADHVQGYRQIHDAAVRAGQGQADTEELREAVVHARPFFEALVRPPHHSATARPETTRQYHGGRQHSRLHRWLPGTGTGPGAGHTRLGHTRKGGAW